MMILDGLPPGDTIEIIAKMFEFANPFDCGGGTGILGGERICVDVTIPLTMTGTGGMTGFFWETVLYGFMEINTAPRVPGNDSFDAVLWHLESSHVADLHFDHLDVSMGDGLGFPSPGHVDLNQMPGGDFNVESFFDITWRINFTGAPTGSLSGLGGTTIGQNPYQMGEPYTPVEESTWSMVKSRY